MGVDRSTRANGLTFHPSRPSNGGTSSKPPTEIQKTFEPVNGLCSLIQEYSGHSRRLLLRIDKNGLYHDNRQRESIDDVLDSSKVITLEHLITRGKLKNLKHWPKAILQVILANAHLQFTGSSWTPTIWHARHICFLRRDSDDSAAKIPNLSRPYLSTAICQAPDGESKEGIRGHPYPSLLALGIMLLEIERGETLATWTPLDFAEPKRRPSQGNGPHVHIDADIPKAKMKLSEREGDSHKDFVAAVRACINETHFTALYGDRATLKNDEFRKSIFEDVVLKLETALEAVWERSPKELDKFCADVQLRAGWTQEKTSFSLHESFGPDDDDDAAAPAETFGNKKTVNPGDKKIGEKQDKWD